MARTIQHKRGLEKNLPMLKPGELAFTTDSKKVFVGSDEGNIDITNSVDTSKLATKGELSTVTTALADKANKGEVRLKSQKISGEELTPELLGAMTGQGTVNLLSIPQTESVSLSTLDENIRAGLSVEKTRAGKDFTGTPLANIVTSATGTFYLNPKAKASENGYIENIKYFAQNTGTITFFIGTLIDTTFTKRAQFEATLTQTGVNEITLPKILIKKGECLGILPGNTLGLYSAANVIDPDDSYMYKATANPNFTQLSCNQGKAWLLYNFKMSFIVSGDYQKLQSDIKNTKQAMIFNEDGSIQKVQHKATDNSVVREDIFTYVENTITEVRTLTTGLSITYVYHLDTLETEVL